MADSNEKRTVGFYANYVSNPTLQINSCANLQQDIYGRKFNVTNIPVENFTHISYAFANISNVTGEVTLSDTWADIEDPYPGNTTSANNL